MNVAERILDTFVAVAVSLATGGGIWVWRKARTESIQLGDDLERELRKDLEEVTRRWLESHRRATRLERTLLEHGIDTDEGDKDQ